MQYIVNYPNCAVCGILEDVHGLRADGAYEGKVICASCILNSMLGSFNLFCLTQQVVLKDFV